MLKRFVSTYLPDSMVNEAKRAMFMSRVRRGTFVPHEEPEIGILSREVQIGAVVIDVGANVGHYALHLSKCVGEMGTVIAMEPMAETFELLCSNVAASKARNVTLLNVAASSAYGMVSMGTPLDSGGIRNYYRAKIGVGPHRVMCITIDSLQLPRVDVIKIDAEGHDMEVLLGAKDTIKKHKPLLIVETEPNSEIAKWLKGLGYAIERTGDSPNCVARYG